jgi:hypothetical protein
VPYSYDPEAAGLIEEGVHRMTVTSIEETTSKRGDPMWVVRLEDGHRREVTEWIVQTPNIIDWKFKPLWQAAGFEWPRERAILDEQQLVDREVQVTIMHERTQDFGTQARIQGYAKPGEGDLPGQEAFEVGEPVRSGASAIDDDIPFAFDEVPLTRDEAHDRRW